MEMAVMLIKEYYSSTYAGLIKIKIKKIQRTSSKP
jgi:hypothetical protein